MDYKLTETQCKIVVKNAAWELFRYCAKNNIHYVVFGLSGGLDSAIILALACMARHLAGLQDYRLTPLALIMPCQSNPEAKRLAYLVINEFRCDFKEIDLTDEYEYEMINSYDNNALWIREFRESTEEKKINDAAFQNLQTIAQGNIKARLRMKKVYLFAGLLNGLVLSTDNYSELLTGFWTLHGDVGDYGMIQQILKGTELYDLARYLQIPQGIIDAKPDDGLGVKAGGDEAQLGASYQVVDKVMIALIQNGFNPQGDLAQLKNLPDIPGIDSDIVMSLAKRCLKSAFKRKGVINLTREELELPPIETLKL